MAWSLDALRFAADMLEDPGEAPLPVLILMTARAEALPERPTESAELSRLMALPSVSRLDIGPLGAEHRALLVRSMLGLEGDLAVAVTPARSQNPHTSGFRLAEGAPVELPEDLAVVWRERIARVLEDSDAPQVEREALELAAVLGLDVDAGEWAAICEAAGLAPPWALVEALLRERLAAARVEGPRVGWSFVHGMLRESVLAQAARAGRLAGHHRRCAAELERREGAGVDAELAERLGRHLLAGGQPADALAPLLRAATTRMNGGDYRQAELMLQRRAVGLKEAGISEADPRAWDGEVVWIQLLVFQGRFPEAEARTAELVRGTDRPELRALHLTGLFYVGYMHRMAGLFDAAWAELSALDPLLRASGDNALLLRVVRERGRIQLDRGDLAGAAETLQEALMLSRTLSDPDREGFALRDLSILHLRAGRTALGLQHTRQARARFVRSGNRWGIADALNMLGEVEREEGRLDQAEQRYRESIERFRAIGSYDAIIPQLNLCMVLLSRDQLAELGPLLDSTLFAARHIRNRRLEALALGLCLGWAASKQEWNVWVLRWDELGALGPAADTADIDLATVLERSGHNASVAGADGLALEVLRLAAAVWRAVSRPDDAARVEAHIIRLTGAFSP